jgi:heme oxygenase
LREATADAHAALDDAIGALPDLPAYRRYLAGTAAFRQVVETAIAHSPPENRRDLPAPLTLSPLIKADMGDLEVTVDNPPERRELSQALATRGGAAGVLYVIESSVLGARLLMRRAAALGLGETRGARHLVAQTAERERWPRFLYALERIDGLDMDDAVRAAATTFAVAASAFDRAMPA